MSSRCSRREMTQSCVFTGRPADRREQPPVVEHVPETRLVSGEQGNDDCAGVRREPADQPRGLRVIGRRHPPQRIASRPTYPPQLRRLALPREARADSAAGQDRGNKTPAPCGHAHRRLTSGGTRPGASLASASGAGTTPRARSPWHLRQRYLPWRGKGSRAVTETVALMNAVDHTFVAVL
jgi:hypothetical protein